MTVLVHQHQHHQIVRIRMIEEAIAGRYREQKMRCPVHLSIGQEVIAVGVCSHLSQNDYVVSGHRAHAHYLAKGGNLNRMIAEMYGKASGCCLGHGGSMHLIDLEVGFLGSTPIVGGSIPVGVGAAFGSILRGDSRTVAIFFGEGATEEGVFSESLNFAALEKLPVLFICENNLYSVYSPLIVRQPPGRDLIQIAKGHGVLALKGDGYQLEEVNQITAHALGHIRAGHGPVLLEYSTYRFREHCGPDVDPYQPQEEVEEWKKRDTVPLLQNALPIAILKEFQEEIMAAFAFAEASPWPIPGEVSCYA